MDWDSIITALLVTVAFVAVVARRVLAKRAPRRGALAHDGCSTGCSGCSIGARVVAPASIETCEGER
jgi:hypothetical protein